MAKARQLSLILSLILLTITLVGCGQNKSSSLADGTYSCEVTLEGGTGKATVESPCTITVTDGRLNATIIWSSKNYDYMIVNGEKYINEARAGEPSCFTFPIDEVPADLNVIGDTTAMSTPHEIEYTLHFGSIN